MLRRMIARFALVAVSSCATFWQLSLVPVVMVGSALAADSASLEDFKEAASIDAEGAEAIPFDKERELAQKIQPEINARKEWIQKTSNAVIDRLDDELDGIFQDLKRALEAGDTRKSDDLEEKLGKFIKDQELNEKLVGVSELRDVRKSQREVFETAYVMVREAGENPRSIQGVTTDEQEKQLVSYAKIIANKIDEGKETHSDQENIAQAKMAAVSELIARVGKYQEEIEELKGN